MCAAADFTVLPYLDWLQPRWAGACRSPRQPSPASPRRLRVPIACKSPPMEHAVPPALPTPVVHASFLAPARDTRDPRLHLAIDGSSSTPPRHRAEAQHQRVAPLIRVSH
eukprot:7384559-Prymnesium_polylepis.2